MTIWDSRYSNEQYIFGTEPNDFLASVISQIPMGRVLCLGDGEGRNGVFLAQHGYDVTSLDHSQVGLAKTQRLAAQRGVSITTLYADLNDYVIEPEAWSAIVSIFLHLPQPLRTQVHHAAVAGLAHGGVLVLEAYTPKQIEYRTGGPPDVDVMMKLDDLRHEFAGLDFVIAQETEREIREGAQHHGKSAVVQLLGIRD